MVAETSIVRVCVLPRALTAPAVAARRSSLALSGPVAALVAADVVRGAVSVIGTAKGGDPRAPRMPLAPCPLPAASASDAEAVDAAGGDGVRASAGDAPTISRSAKRGTRCAVSVVSTGRPVARGPSGSLLRSWRPAIVTTRGDCGRRRTGRGMGATATCQSGPVDNSNGAARPGTQAGRVVSGQIAPLLRYSRRTAASTSVSSI